MSETPEDKVKSLELSIRKALDELDVGNALTAAGILECALETPGTIGYANAQRLIAAAHGVRQEGRGR